MNLIRQAIDIYKGEGIVTLLNRTTNFFIAKSQFYQNLIKLALLDRFNDYRSSAISIKLRKSVLDSDTLSLLLQLEAKQFGGDLFLIVDNKEYFFEINSGIYDELEVNYSVVEIGSQSFLRALLETEIFILTSNPDIWIWRKYLSKDRDYIRLYHGVIVKGYGNMRNEAIEKKVNNQDQTLNKAHYGAKKHSVASDIELFLRSCAEGRHPAAFSKTGYPRFERAYKLTEKQKQPLISKQFKKLISGENQHKRILYAPTHKDDGLTNIFPFDDFDLHDFKSFLEAHNTQLFLRMHVSEWNHPKLEKYIDGEHIIFAGQNVSPSSLEILPYMDVMITDYSTIFVEFLPFNRPIVFVNDDLKSYKEKRGLIFNPDDYFPGKFVDNYESFKEHLVTCLNGGDSYEEDRKFVRRSFIPIHNQNFVDSILSDS